MTKPMGRRTLGLLSGLLMAWSVFAVPGSAQPVHAGQTPAAPPAAPPVSNDASAYSQAVPPTRTAAVTAPSGRGLRVKDIAQFQGARDNQLTGIGLVIGLNGTGDSPSSAFTYQELANMLERLGLNGLRGSLKVKNVAGVMVVANLPPFMKPGQRIDVTVASLGDAKSIQDGVLIQTPLRAADGRIYAVAQGSVSIGGFGVEAKGATTQKNATTVGRIPNGGLVEKDVPVTVLDENFFTYIHLINPDYSTASDLADRVNRNLVGQATAMDAATVRVFVPVSWRDHMVDLIARIENIELNPENNAAKIVIEERTGTVIIGQNVRISAVAITHGGLTIKVTVTKTTSQPPPLSGGTTTTTEEANIQAIEEPASAVLFRAGTTLQDLVKALQALKMTGRDIITIIQNIKAAGALNAKLEIL